MQNICRIHLLRFVVFICVINLIGQDNTLDDLRSTLDEAYDLNYEQLDSLGQVFNEFYVASDQLTIDSLLYKKLNAYLFLSQIKKYLSIIIDSA